MSRKTPFIQHLLDNPLSGPDIEARSFEVIDRETSHDLPPDQWEIARRMIHTTGDIDLVQAVRISPDAVLSGTDALRRGASVYADSNMIRAGLSLVRLRAVNAIYSKENLICHVADQDVAEKAREKGLPRSLFGIRKAREILHGGIVVFGNAPVALLELNRLIIEEGVRPALVVAMPVGFVHVIESKEEFMSLGIPYVALAGRRGGSALAVSVIHALCTLATRRDISVIEK